MTDSTAIVNPLDKTEALLFWVSERQVLALEHRRLNDDTYDEFVDNFSPDWMGLIQHPGHIAAVKHDKSFVVYGYTKSPNQKKEDTVYVSQISPIINPLAKFDEAKALTGKWRTLAATTDGHSNDWVYFFADESAPADPSNIKPVIVQFSANVKKQKGANAEDLLGVRKEPFTNALPKPTSKLAALYDVTAGVGQRHTVFFQRQGKDPSIFYHFAGDEKPSAIDKTKDATDGTPIAVLSIPDPTHRVIHVYYVDLTHTLQRAKRQDDTWTFGYAVAADISPSSDLTAVWDAQNKVVQLFFQTNDSGTEITQVSDDPNRQP